MMILLGFYLTGFFISFGILMERGFKEPDTNKMEVCFISFLGSLLSWIMVGSTMAELLDNTKKETPCEKNTVKK